MLFRLFLLFTLIPIAELYLLIEIGGRIGALNTVLIIFFTGAAGAYLARQEGFNVLARIQENIRNGVPPAGEMLQGLFILIGGFMLLTPGFLTDLLGFSMLLPPTRALYAKAATRIIQKRIRNGQWQISPF